MIPPDSRLKTRLQHVGEEEKIHGSVVPPIFQNSLFVYDDAEELVGLLEGPYSGPKHVYSRSSNPTLDVLEQKLAMLEGSEAAKATGSGMAAISAIVLATVKQGDHIVTVDTCYYPARLLFTELLPRFGVTATFVDGRDADELLAALRPETTLVYLETPSSALFRLQDLAAITSECKRRGITTICDNSYATPLYQRPIEHGVDVVVHSASKYLGGHSDLTAGVICASKERLDAMLMSKGVIPTLGSALAPFPAWLMLRGLRTLALRIEAHRQTAQRVAEWLQTRPEVAQVNHVGLADYPQAALRDKQMSAPGGLFSFEPKNQDRAAAFAFVNALRVFQRGVSWGGFESLALPLFPQPGDYPEPRSVIRLYCGLEDAEDLIEDLSQAFHLLQQPG